MNNLFNKADEMEMAINFKAMRISWIVLVLALVTWNLVDFFSGKDNFLPGIIVLVNVVIFFVTKSYYSKKMSSSNDKE